ncbi:MAG TPA: NADH-ubiquinone oxidoreductase-F iron-sulfur binding region domain-containing protein [Acidobacteriaceae bacterium]
MPATPEVLVQIEPGRNKLGVFEDLRHVQESVGFVPTNEIARIATRRGVAIKDVHSVASYYPHFRLKPPVRVDVRVCDDMSCHLNGARQLRHALEHQYAGASDIVQVRDISCVGRCDHAPVVSINEHYYEAADFKSVVAHVDREILSPRIDRPNAAPSSPEERGVKIQCDPYASEAERYSIYRRLIELKNFDETLALLKQGELRGMGGAGFSTYIKWGGAKKSPGPEKFVVCNADESEPGTIKDRFILQYLPHMVFEGMMVAGAIVGAQKGYLYIRHEYELQTEVLREELARIRALGLLGRNILGSGVDFDLEVFVSPGGYICGEETALMEAIQGNRAEPRNKPPRTINSGLWGKPTALNNVETFTHAITILGKGGEWYRNFGRPGSPGVKFVGITGNVRQPGVFEVPMGITYRELIDDFAGGALEGREIVGFAPSGPSSGYLPASLLDTPLDWDKVKALQSMLGSGAVVVVDNTGCMLDMALTSVRFYRNESCGKCSPCRIGTQKLVDILENWTLGRFARGDLELLNDLSAVLRLTSLCGLGQIAPAPITSVMKHFPDIVREHVVDRHCRGGVCFTGSAT